MTPSHTRDDLTHPRSAVELKVYPGMFHGFWRMRGMLPEASQAIDYAAAKMKEAMTLPLPGRNS